jgi:hypothetical protein
MRDPRFRFADPVVSIRQPWTLVNSILLLPMRPLGCGSAGGQGLREPMTTDNEFDSTAINEIIHGLDPVDWTQLRLLADLTPAERSSTCTMIAQAPFRPLEHAR